MRIDFNNDKKIFSNLAQDCFMLNFITRSNTLIAIKKIQNLLHFDLILYDNLDKCQNILYFFPA